jgi:hypothetical protein
LCGVALCGVHVHAYGCVCRCVNGYVGVLSACACEWMHACAECVRVCGYVGWEPGPTPSMRAATKDSIYSDFTSESPGLEEVPFKGSAAKSAFASAPSPAPSAPPATPAPAPRSPTGTDALPSAVSASAGVPVLSFDSPSAIPGHVTSNPYSLSPHGTTPPAVAALGRAGRSSAGAGAGPGPAVGSVLTTPYVGRAIGRSCAPAFMPHIFECVVSLSRCMWMSVG